MATRWDGFDARGFKPTDWSGVQLRSHGTYTLNVLPVGIATAPAAGAGCGAKELLVDCRITVRGCAVGCGEGCVRAPLAGLGLLVESRVEGPLYPPCPPPRALVRDGAACACMCVCMRVCVCSV
jgi:hypothetical protein